MNLRFAFSVAAVLLSLVPTVAWAQLPVPQLNSIFPCGARLGETVECIVAGGDLNDATGLYFSHPAIKAETAGANKFRVTVAKDVPVGRYDVRVICPTGVSSCRSFVVGDRAEFVEKEPNNLLDKAQRVELPITVNGQISGGIDLDHFVFAAKKGQRVIINCWAWRIDSRLDATLMVFDPQGKELGYGGDFFGKDPFLDFTAPVDGDYTVKIWDFIYTGGTEYVYRLDIGSLPYIDAVLPAAVRPGQTNTVTLFGRNLPGGKPVPGGASIQGRPLEVVTREISVPADVATVTSLHGGEAIRPPQASLDGIEYRLTTPEGSSNPLFVGFTSDPIVLEQEPNNDQATAQRLSVPSEVSGSFSPAGDVDYFAFTAKKNEKLVLEIYGERQSGMVDPILVGIDAKGKRLTPGGMLDDVGRNIGQLRFTTTTRDARWDFTAPADGEYFVQVRDLYFQQRGEPRFTYRLSIHAPQPDFRLMAVPTAEVQPDATVVRQGCNYWLDVLAFRNDGHDEPIYVEASQLPPGVTCEPVVIGPGKTSVPLVFHAAADAPIGHADIRITGKSKAGETDVVRLARAGGLIWSTTNTPGIARMADTIVLAVRETGPFSLTATAAKSEVAAGEKLSIKIKITRAADWSEDVQLSGFDLPQNANVPLVTVKKNATDGEVELTLPTNSKPGLFTFTINGSGQVARNYAREKDPAKRGNNMRCIVPSNPITITVTPPVKK
jgi:hypothetical protein